MVWDFAGNGAAAGDVLQFEGFGTTGVIFEALGGDQYRITSADGSVQDIITVYGGVDIANDVLFVAI